MKKFVFSLGMLLAAVTTSAQEMAVSPDSTYLNLMHMAPEDYINIKLPPLHILMENARTSPFMQFYEAGIEVSERDLKSARREWLTFFKISGNYNYGTSNLQSQNYFEYGDPEIRGSAQIQNYWNVGGGIAIPLEALFNRRNKIQKQKKMIEQNQYEMERSFNEMRLQIIELYSTIVQHLSTLQSATDAMELAKAQYAGVETDFMNGQTDMSSLSVQKSMEASAIQTYEVLRSALNSALLKLEVLTNTPIITPRPAAAPAQKE